MEVTLSHKDLINLVCGTTPKTQKICESLTEEKLMYFSGNQWNENWSWNRKSLDLLSDDDLFCLYKDIVV